MPARPVVRPVRSIVTSALEVLAVVVIVAALVGVAVPFFQDNLSEAQSTKAEQDLWVIRKALALRQAQEPWTRRGGDLEDLRGRYLQEIPRDPWGNPYLFDAATGTLRSWGADGVPGGSGGEADVVVPAGIDLAGRASWSGLLARRAAPGVDGARLASDLVDPREEPRATFGLDVDTGSYTLARRFLLEGGRLPPREVVRVEEFVNARAADDPGPGGGADFAVTTELAPSPLTAGRWLLRVALKARSARRRERAGLRLTFLVDESGSMSAPDRLPLVRRSLTELVEALEEGDQVALVTFGEDVEVELPMTPLTRRGEILEAIDGLATRGATNLDEGLARAYQVARAAAAPGRTSRVVLVSDGAANAGVTDPDGLVARVRAGADAGVLLTALGFGLGGVRDDLLERVADRCNGHYAYVDTIAEARRVLVEDLEGTMLTVARDARAQVELRPEAVRGYRLLGYENRAMADEAFRDDGADAGEVGAGHLVRALLELDLHQDAAPGHVAVVRLRYLPPEGGEARELAAEVDQPSGEVRGSPALQGEALAAALALALAEDEGARPAALRALADGLAARYPATAADPGAAEVRELLAAANGAVEQRSAARAGG